MGIIIWGNVWWKPVQDNTLTSTGFSCQVKFYGDGIEKSLFTMIIKALIKAKLS